MKGQSVASAAVIVVGILLMATMMYVESEPGGIPVLMVLAGVAWHLLIRRRQRATARPSPSGRASGASDVIHERNDDLL